MKVLYVTSEANPFLASGGLGDVMGALPLEVLKAQEGNTVEVIMPLYDTVKDAYRKNMEKVCDLSFSLSWRQTGASIYKYDLSGVTYYFVENHYYFDRGRLYGEFDDAERFAFFSLAVVEFIKSGITVPDVLHANDWQSALAVIYLKTEYAHIKSLSSVKTLYTIHNIEYQGKFDPYILGDVFGIDRKYYNHVEFDGCINLMKGAIVLSDFVNTVSPNYARELENEFFAFGLSEIIKSQKHKMCGVINGIDYNYFSPDLGGDIYKRYTARSMKNGKLFNKLALQKEVGLPESADVPLLVMITRLATAKGIDLVLHVIDEILAENVQMIVLGTGESDYEQALIEAEKKHPNLRALIKFDRVISKKMYAGADIFLMPSRSEPCGLAQMIACSYGTVPIVRSVGGLYDSIIPYGEKGANGFRFDNYNAHELLFKVKDAINLYNDKEKWHKLRRAAKASDFSWKSSAEKYLQIYEKLNG